MIFCGDVSATQITLEYFETCNVEALFLDVLGEFKRAGKVINTLLKTIRCVRYRGFKCI